MNINFLKLMPSCHVCYHVYSTSSCITFKNLGQSCKQFKCECL